MTEMQNQFEEWAKKKGHKMDRAPEPYNYDWASTECAWQAWQASRAAVVVKLPDVFDGSPDNATYYDYMYRKTEIEKALDDAGVDYE